MNSGNITKLLLALGVNKMKQGSRYVSSTCPLAFWTHPGGYDRTPSFGVKVVTDGTSNFSCKSASCGIKGSDLKELVWKYERLSRKNCSDMLRFVQEHESFADVMKRLEDKPYSPLPPVDIGGVRISADEAQRILGGSVEDLAKGVQTVPEEETKIWRQPVPAVVRGWATEYLAESGLTLDDAHFWKLGIAPKVPYVNRFGKPGFLDGWRLIFPIWDCQGQMIGWSGRFIGRLCGCRAHVPFDKFLTQCSICEIEIDPAVGCKNEHEKKTKVLKVCPSCKRYPPTKYFHRQGFLSNLFLYGEHLRVPEVRVAILVEGFSDVITLYKLGYRNVFAVMGSSLSKIHQKKLHQWVDEAIVLPDGDDGGRGMGKRIVDDFGRFMKTRMVLPPDGMDPSEMGLELLVSTLGVSPSVGLASY